MSARLLMACGWGPPIMSPGRGQAPGGTFSE
jgi:hypothetical protein